MKKIFFAFALLLSLTSFCGFADKFDQLRKTLEPLSREQLVELINNEREPEDRRVAACHVYRKKQKESFEPSEDTENYLPSEFVVFLRAVTEKSQDEHNVAYALDILCIGSDLLETHEKELCEKLWKVIRSGNDDFVKVFCLETLEEFPNQFTSNWGEIKTLLMQIVKHSKNEEARLNALSMLGGRVDENEKQALAGLAFEVAKTTRDKTLEAHALCFVVTRDPKLFSTHQKEIVTRLFAIAESTDDNDLRREISSVLSGNEEIKRAHKADILKMKKVYLAQCKTTDDKIGTLQLWAFDPDCPQDEKTKFTEDYINACVERGGYALENACHCLSGNFRDKLGAALLKVALDPQRKDRVKATCCLMQNFPALAEPHLDDFTAILINILRTSEKASHQAEVLSVLWSKEQLRTQYRDELVPHLLRRLKDPCLHSWQRSETLWLLQQDSATVQKYKAEIKEAMLAHLSDADKEYDKLQVLQSLLDYDVLEGQEQSKIITQIFELAQATQDSGCRFQAIQVLWRNPKAREAHYEGLVALWFKLIEDKDQSRSYVLNQFWYAPKVKEAHRKKLVAELLKDAKEAKSLREQSSAINSLWCDAEVKVEHYDDLVKCLLTHLSVTDFSVAQQAFEYLWNDPQTKKTYNALIIESALLHLRLGDVSQRRFAANILWSDNETKENNRSELEEAWLSLLEELDDNSKCHVCVTLCNDEAFRRKYADRMITILIKQIQQSGFENSCYALVLLWNDEGLSEDHRKVLTAELLKLAKESPNVSLQAQAVGLLWNHIETQTAHRDDLVKCLLTHLTVDDGGAVNQAFQILWCNKSEKETNRAVLEDKLLQLLRQGDIAQKDKAVGFLWSDEVAREKYRDELESALVEQLESENRQRSWMAESSIEADAKTRKKYKGKIVANKLKRIKEEGASPNTYTLQCLWNDKEVEGIAREELEGYLVELLKRTDVNCKEHIYGILWGDTEMREKYRHDLETLILEQLESKDRHKRNNALSFLRSDEKATNKHIDKIVRFAIKQAKEEVQAIGHYLYELRALWGTDHVKGKARDELGTYFVELLSGDILPQHKDSVFQVLWDNAEAKERYREELGAYLVRELERDGGRANVSVFDKLWNDPALKQKHAAVLNGYALERLRILGTTEKKRFAEKLWYQSELDGDVYKEVFKLLFLWHVHARQPMFKELVSSQNWQPELCEQLFRESYAYLGGASDVKLCSYILFGASFQDEFNSYILGRWRILTYNQKMNVILELDSSFGLEHPRVQELLMLFVRENGGGEQGGAVALYAELCRKVTEDPYEHHPATLEVTLRDNNNEERTLYFTVNPEIFAYVPVAQTRLANFHDVDALLGDGVQDDKVNAVRIRSEFQDYFTSSSEEAIMLQAMVKRYRTMHDQEGCKAMVALMHDMHQCKTGMNQAIWDHYSVESLPIPKADLRTFATWLVRLRDTANPYLTDDEIGKITGLTRADSALLMANMLKQGHMFREHITGLTTDHAERVKGIFGKIASLEKDVTDRKELGKILKQVLMSLKALSEKETFYVEMDRLCKIYEVYLPANKFGDLLSDASIEGLIAKLKASDIEGRGDLEQLRAMMKAFVASPVFKKQLGDFNDESGAKLRVLMEGYVSNGWVVGLLNLVELAQEEKLEHAVEAIYERTKIDKDMELTWRALRKVVSKEMQGLKRESLNALTDQLLGRRGAHAEYPHPRTYIDHLLGRAIGLRAGNALPSFDHHLSYISSNIGDKSLQEALDLFHEHFTVQKVIDHFNGMLARKELSVVDPMSGNNAIWILLSSAATEMLKRKGIEDTDDFDADDLIYHPTSGATTLAMALFLTHIGILQEVDADGNQVAAANQGEDAVDHVDSDEDIEDKVS